MYYCCTCRSSFLSQLQLQSSVHLQLAFLHAHLAPHPFWLLQLNFISSLQALDATGKMVHTGSHDWLSLSRVQPKPSGVGVCCSLCSLVHHIPAWYTTRFKCCNNASWVGGSRSICFPFLQKSSFLASFTYSTSLVFSYKMTVKRSSSWKCCETRLTSA